MSSCTRRWTRYSQSGRRTIPLKIEFTPAAKHDLRRILSYTSDHYGKAQAERYHRRLDEAISHLIDFPNAGIARDDIMTGCRSTMCAEHAVFYRHRSGMIEILRVLHQHMDFPKHFP